MKRVKKTDKMAVNIVTVYRSSNYGSVLQAMALYRVLREKYPTYLVNARTRSLFRNTYIPLIKGFLKGLFTANFCRMRCSLHEMNILNPLFFRRVERSVYRAKGCFVFGSDEIWNISRREMAGFPILWGVGIDSGRKMSYAPSVNNCSIDTLINHSISKAIRDFRFLSARDQYSCACLQQITDRPVEKVLDPTMLITKDQYLAETTISINGNYIAVYLHSPSKELIRAIKKLSAQTGKRLVSIGHWRPWADEVVISRNPFAFYEKADFIITNTFHGTAFAINFEKNFAVVSAQQKVLELLKDINLQSRFIPDGEMCLYDLKRLMEVNIDYREIRKQIEKQRECSLAYLYGSIDQMSCETKDIQ